MSYPYEPYKWWVNNVLPLVYDDSLSYYEVLSKLKYYVDGLVYDVKRLTEIVNTIEGIEDIEQFTEMLNRINAKIGELENLQTENKDDIVSAINSVVADLGAVELQINEKYTKPDSGIPEDDLSEALREKINEQFVQNKNYNNLSNKPKINHIEIEGDHEPGYYGIGTYSLPENGIPESDLNDDVKAKLNASSENTEKIDGIAPSIDSMTADRDYDVGEILYINGKLYRVTTKVIANAPFVIGSNIEQTTLNNEIDSINDDINKLKIATGAESYDMDSGVITTADTQVYTLFFRYFKAIAGEDYLFIVIPASSNVTNSGYNINIYSENGDVAYTFNSGNNVEDYKNERRFTFSAPATGNYYCGLKKDANGTSYPVVQTVKLQYTASQGGESLVQMVSELLPLREDVEGIEESIENIGAQTLRTNEALNGVNGNEVLYYTYGTYIDCNPSSGINIPPVQRESGTYQSIAIPCSPGDKFTITGSTEGNNAHFKVWLFVTATGEKIRPWAENGATLKNEVIVAPENAVYLISDCRLDHESFLCRNKALPVEVQEIKDYLNSPDLKDVNDLMPLIEPYVEGGTISSSFTLRVPAPKVPKILSVVSMYSGDTAPTIAISNKNPNDYVLIRGIAYDLGSNVEMRRNEWRIPPIASNYDTTNIEFNIPEGTTVEIREAKIEADQRNRFMSDGIKIIGHAGCNAPANTVEAFINASKLGYDYMITIPKITADGVPVCFHDDDHISGELYWTDGSAITGEYDKSITEYTYDYIMQNFRVKSLGWGILRVCSMDDFFRVCSLTGMSPQLSIHSADFGNYATGLATIKELAKKWNLLGRLSVKSGTTSIMSTARSVFGKDIDSYIWLNGASHAPNDPFDGFKTAGFIDSSATDLTDCEYNLVAEYYVSQATEGGTYYTQTVAQINSMIEKGMTISIWESERFSGKVMNDMINLGVKQFTTNNHVSMGLNW